MWSHCLNLYPAHLDKVYSLLQVLVEVSGPHSFFLSSVHCYHVCNQGVLRAVQCACLIMLSVAILLYKKMKERNENWGNLQTVPSGLKKLKKEMKTAKKLANSSFCPDLLQPQSVQFGPVIVGSSGGHEGWFNRDLLPVFSVGGHCEQFRHGHWYPVFDVVHLAFPVLTTALPCRGVWHAGTMWGSISWQLPEGVPVGQQESWSSGSHHTCAQRYKVLFPLQAKWSTRWLLIWTL